MHTLFSMIDLLWPTIKSRLNDLAQAMENGLPTKIYRPVQQQVTSKPEASIQMLYLPSSLMCFLDVLWQNSHTWKKGRKKGRVYNLKQTHSEFRVNAIYVCSQGLYLLARSLVLIRTASFSCTRALSEKDQ